MEQDFKLFKIKSAPRPLRIVFLIQENEHYGIMLDAIFKYCQGIWGGRFSPIVPISDGVIPDEYRTWMLNFDPDVIYTFVDLDIHQERELLETYCPSVLQRHRVYSEDISVRSFRPEVDIKPLSVETIIPFASAPYRFNGSKQIQILDCRGRARDDKFLSHNFGNFLGSCGHSFPAYLENYGEELLVLADDEYQPRRQYSIHQEVKIKNRNQLLAEMADKPIWTMARLSALAAPRLEIRQHKWADSFNLIVGDSFIDRLSFWNARSNYPKYKDRDYVTLIMREEDFEDESFLVAIRKFLKRRNHVSLGGSNNTPCLTLRSSSISNSRLEAMKEIIQAEDKFSYYMTETISSITDCIPQESQLKHSNFIASEDRIIANSQKWQEDLFRGNEFRISPRDPNHILSLPNELIKDHFGNWAVDLIIERQLNYSVYSNVTHTWQLPRRFDVAELFRPPYSLGSRNGYGTRPRVSLNGRLTLYKCSEMQFPVVTIPTDEELFATGLLKGLDYKTSKAEPLRRLKDIRRSSNGKYFWGVIKIMGGLNEATEFLLHDFWQVILERLGASSSKSVIRKNEVQAAIRKRLGEFNSLTASNWIEKTSTIVLQESDVARTKVPHISWSDLNSEFVEYQEKYWNSIDVKHLKDSEVIWHKQAESSSLVEYVKLLCEQQVLHQGYEIKCPSCLHKTWVSIDVLSSVTKCEVCRHEQAAPIDRPWSFRLNSFLREALRSQGILPLIWTLSKLRPFNENSFYFEGPTDIWENNHRDEAGPDTDLDLICITNGKVSMIEVKQSDRNLNIELFIKTVKLLRPDEAILSVMGTKSGKVSSAFAKLKSALEDTGILAKLIIEDPPTHLDSPHF